MTAWLSSMIQSDLGEVMDLASGRKADPLQDKYEDDGSNLRVRASKPGVVQIIKWESSKEPFVVTISDSVTYLKATISSSAAAEHKKRTRKRITDGTLGNIIQLLQVEIVATHLGPRSSRITLLVSNFRVVGSDKSGQFGNPRPFEVTQDGQQLLEKLSSTRASIQRFSHAPGAARTSDENNPPISRADDVPPIEDVGLGSQQLFSQVPAPPTLGGATEAAVKKPLIGMRLPQRANEMHKPGGDSKPMNQAEALLQMIKARDTLNGSVESLREAEEQASMPTSAFQPGMTTDTQEDDPSKAVEMAPVKRPPLELPVSASVIESSSPLKEKLSSGKSVATKIRSRDVKIPSDQQKLLDQEHAWLPAKPGRRGPIANVPIAVLQEITRGVDQLRAQPVETEILPTSERSPKQKRTSDGKDESDEDTDTEAESLVLSADWPPSSPIPAPRELPPDSSMETVNIPNDKENILSPHRSQSPADADVNKNGIITSAMSPSEYATSAVRDKGVRSIEQMSSSVGISPRHTNNNFPQTCSVDTSTTGEGITLPAAVQNATMTNLESDLEDSEYELDTAVPLKLSQPSASATDRDSTQEIPATAYDQQEPVLQVKRTPYVCMGTHSDQPQNQQRSSAYDIYSSPSKRRRVGSIGTPQKLGLGTFDNDSRALSPASNHAVKTPQSLWDGSQTHASRVEETSSAMTADQKAMPTPGSPIIPHSIMNMPNDGQGAQALEPEEPGASEAIRVLGDPTATGRDHPPVLSPYVTKRRKAYKSPIAFKFTREEYPKEDPSVTARRHREEFFASRKSSRSTAHTHPPAIGSGEPESPIDNKFQDFSRASIVCNSYSKRSNGQDSLRTLPHQSTSPRSGQSTPDINAAQQVKKVEELSSLPAQVSGRSPDRVSKHTSDRASIAPSAPDTNGHATDRKLVVASIEQPSLSLAQSVSSNLHSVSTKLEGLSSTEISQKTNHSGQAQSLPELMTPALSIVDLPQHESSSPTLGTASQAASAQPDLFVRFRATYPDYLGTREHFVGMCKRIHQLSQADRMVHRSLWDDFIVRHRLDYPIYTQRCVEKAEDAKPYEHFYRDEIDRARYTNGIIQPATLAQMLPLDFSALAAQGSVSPVKVESPNAHFSAQGRLSSISTRRSSPVIHLDHGTIARTERPPSSEALTTDAKDDQPPLSFKSKFSAAPKGLEPPLVVSNKAKVIIDLTDDRSSSPPVTSRPSSIRPSPRKIARPEDQHDIKGSPRLGGGRIRRDDEAERGPRSKDLSPSSTATTRRKGEAEVAYENRSRSDGMTGAGSSKAEAAKAAQASSGRGPQHLEPESTRNSLDMREDVRTAASSSKKGSEQQSMEVDEWWKDDNTPFREYVRLYHSISPGKGNAWAAEKGQGKDKGTPAEARRGDISGMVLAEIMGCYL
ncbi:MAG: hypothetical protein Q9206_002691 [Seirophora lacunosa]